MDLSKIDLTPRRVLTVAGIVLVALVVISLSFRLVSDLLGSYRMRTGSSELSAPSAMYQKSYGGVATDAAMPELSARNIGGTPGDGAEQFEATDYSASIETRNLSDVCSQIAGWKKFDYVVFENANEGERNCSFTFKVKRDRVTEILDGLTKLNPRELTENTQTIKATLDDFTSETEILTKKLAVVEDTLQKATTAYDELTALATRAQNVDSLTKIIDSKLNTIERLTQDRINISAQLERLSRGKATQLDRLEYTYFYVSVTENKLIDGQSLGDSWRNAMQGFFHNLNRIAQDLTINLVVLLIFIAQYVVYFFIILIVAKYVWRATKYLWRR